VIMIMRTIIKFKKSVLSIFLSSCLLIGSNSGAEAEELPPVEVNGDAIPFGTESRIRSDEPSSSRVTQGKKVTRSDLSDRPAVVDQSLRQILSDIPGLHISDVANQSFSSISYRGLGDPHESFNLQTLEDGLPLSADPYGYPAVYYIPPIASLEAVEFFRGGSSLLYGPQTGGALNYVTKLLTPDDQFSAITQQTGGSFGFFSSYNELTSPILKGNTPTTARLIYSRSQSEGFRVSNQDRGADYFQAKIASRAFDTDWSLKVDRFDADFGEPGGLAQGFRNTTTPSDRLFIERTSATLGADRVFSNGNTVRGRLRYADYERLSRRQTLGTAPVFGGVPNGTTNTIQDQTFEDWTLDLRSQMPWRVSSVPIRTTFGVFGFNSKSDLSQSTGADPLAVTGTLQRQFDRESRVVALFTESVFDFSGWRIVPGVRVEGIFQRIEEKTNTVAPTALRNDFNREIVPLWGLGLEVDLGAKHELYGNASRGYKPMAYQDTIPLAPGTTISSDLNEANTHSFEVGTRTRTSERVSYDFSVFYVNFSDQFGRVGTQFQNTGASRHWGADLSTNTLLVKASRVGSWSLHSNLSYLKARYTEGPLKSNHPQYAPGFLTKHRLKNRLSARFEWDLIFTAASGQFGDDGNSAQQRIPGYAVFDLQFQFELAKLLGPVQKLTLIGSLQNLTGRKYWTRVRTNGIDPAAPFGAQVGLRGEF
jgi:Fe(3+) dicitrate transport protein